MASCAHIDQLLQTYLDNELSHADRVILEQHVGECAACAGVMRRHQALNAEMFETFAGARLNRDLTDYVVSHLPDMERPAVDVAKLNFRAKNPARLRRHVFRLIPLAAAVLLVFLAAVINTRWPESAISPQALGIVANVDGVVTRGAEGDSRAIPTAIKRPAMPGDRFETDGSSRASVLLLGPSEIRLDNDTSLTMTSDRQVTLEHGRIYLDIAKNRRWFKVYTPMGEVTVFGTRFSVEATTGRTTVVVEQGEVQLTHRDNSALFRNIKPGRRAYVEAGLEEVPMGMVDATSEHAWAESIATSDSIREYFAQQIQSTDLVDEVYAEGGYFIETGGNPLRSIVVSWEETSPFLKYCDYEVFVSTSSSDPVFRAHLSGTIFSDPRLSEIELENTGDMRGGIDAVFVRLVPVMDPAAQRVQFKSLAGTIGKGGR